MSSSQHALFTALCNSTNTKSLGGFKVSDRASKKTELKKCLPTSLAASEQPSLLKSKETPKPYCDRTSQPSLFTQTSETTSPSQENFNLSRLDFLVPGQVTPDCEPDFSTQNQPCVLKPCDTLQMGSPVSSSSKILVGLSVEDYEQFLEDSEWSAIVGTIHRSYQQRNWERRKKGKDFSLLPTPTTYAKGSGKCRPAGQTKLEVRLRQFISPGDKLHPAVPGWMMGFPPGWVEEMLMDGGEKIQLPFTQEYVTTHPSDGKQTISTLDQSCQKSQGSHSGESCTCPSCEQPLLNLDDGCGVCGWTRSQSREEAVLTVTGELTVSTPAEKTVLTVNCNSSTVSTRKRKRGEGTGRIQWRTFTKKNGKQYQQPWYDWQMHQGEKTISRSTYIPKRLLSRIQELEDMKAPVREILIELGIVKGKKS